MARPTHRSRNRVVARAHVRARGAVVRPGDVGRAPMPARSGRRCSRHSGVVLFFGACLARAKKVNPGCRGRSHPHIAFENRAQEARDTMSKPDSRCRGNAGETRCASAHEQVMRRSRRRRNNQFAWQERTRNQLVGARGYASAKLTSSNARSMDDDGALEESYVDWSKHRMLVGARGFEPPTTTTPRWCATRLRYAPFVCLRGRVPHDVPQICGRHHTGE